MSTVIVTGSSRGIGLATARELLQRGYTVIGTSTSGQSPIHHASFVPAQLDLADPVSVDACIDFVRTYAKVVSGLINNAAILLEDWGTPEVDLSQLRKTFEVNVFGTIQLTEGLVDLIRDNGRIINLSSGWGGITGRRVGTAAPHYKLSKAALNLYTRLLDERLGSRQIRVSAIDPGWVRSDMGTPSAPKDPSVAAREIAELFESDLPGGRFWSAGKERTW